MSWRASIKTTFS